MVRIENDIVHIYVFLNKTSHRRSYITELYDTVSICSHYFDSNVSNHNLLKCKQMHVKLTGGKNNGAMRGSISTLAHVISCVFLSVSLDCKLKRLFLGINV